MSSQSSATARGSYRRSSAEARGFALVITLSLMVLLTFIAVGLLSLPVISLRSSSLGIARSTAQANARPALMLAIGELQKQMGPDQRITAKAEEFDEFANPHWTGVWNSWAAGKKSDGSPASHGGDDPNEHSSIMPFGVSGLVPTYSEGRRDQLQLRFFNLPLAIT